MITVHHLENSRSQRVLWLLEELGVPYDVVHYKRDPETHLAPPELKAIHPLGKSPVMTDDGQVFAETAAIVEYLIETYGHDKLAPTAGEKLRYRYWLHYAEGSAMPPMLVKFIFAGLPKKVPLLIRPIAKAIVAGVNKAFLDAQLKLHADYWESELAKTGWFAGADITGADIMMSFPLENSRTTSGTATGYPNINAFITRIHARPAYQRALVTGGPYVNAA